MLVAQGVGPQRFRDDADTAGRPDPAEGGADRRPREGVADAHAGQPERLAEGADKHQVGKPFDQPRRGDARKFEVGLVDRDYAG